MSYSVHINGGTRADMRNSIRLHDIRNDEKTGRAAKKRSSSEIHPELSCYNVVFDDDPNRMPEMRKKLDAMSKQRQDRGKRKIRSNCEVFGKGTIQLSDETLEKLGWQFTPDGEKKPVNEQTEQAIKNVKAVYKRLYDSMKKQPDVYGAVFCGALHFDESSPHVDFLIDPLDVEKEQTLRDFKAGKRADGTLKLSGMQDDLGRYAGFDAKLKSGRTMIEAFDLRRGDTASKKKDLAVTTRKTEKRLKTANTKLKGIKKQIEDGTHRKETLDTEITELETRLKTSEELWSWQQRLELREGRVKKQERKLEMAKDAAYGSIFKQKEELTHLSDAELKRRNDEYHIGDFGNAVKSLDGLLTPDKGQSLR